jgi:sulfite exporter TauE/SafE
MTAAAIALWISAGALMLAFALLELADQQRRMMQANLDSIERARAILLPLTARGKR